MCYTVSGKAKIILQAPDWKNIVNQEKILFSRHSLWLCFVVHRSRSTRVETVGFRDLFKPQVTFSFSISACGLMNSPSASSEFIRALLGGPATSTKDLCRVKDICGPSRTPVPTVIFSNPLTNPNLQHFVIAYL